jgi:DNA-binding transcriptional MerR regulator
VILKVLAPYKGREDLSMDDLVHLAAEVVPRVVAGQRGHKVTEVPDARTVRYYITEGLVDRPGGSAGPGAVYGYRHLLKIVAIKALQSEFIPIREIKKAIGSLSVEKLEERLEKWATQRPLGGQSRSWAPAWQTMASEQRPGAARRFLLGLRSGGADAPMMANSLGIALDADVNAQSASNPAPTGWHRFELFPGIELHVREGTEVPDSPSFLSVLASRLRVILEHLRKAGSR